MGLHALLLCRKQGPPASEKMVDDGSGEVKVWIIEGTTMSEYPENLYGQFFSGDSYVVQYTYEDKGEKMICWYDSRNGPANSTLLAFVVQVLGLICCTSGWDVIATILNKVPRLLEWWS